VGEDIEVDEGGLATARVEQVFVFNQPNLVGPNEVQVVHPTVIETTLSIADRLQRQDEQILKALAEKHSILSKLLNDQSGNEHELERIAEQMAGLSVVELRRRNPRELAMSGIVHGNRLLESISRGKR
jgi:hypothetical protein